MRWWFFGVMAYLFLAAQIGLANLAIPTPYGDVRPQWLLVLGVYIGLWAPPSTALLAWAVLGLLMDLTAVVEHLNPETGQVTGFTLIGPYTLGFFAGGYVLNEVRSMLFRKHPLTLGAMTVVCGLAAHLIVVAIFAVRIWYEPLADWGAVDEFAIRFASLLCSACVAVILTWPLARTAPLFAFQAHKTGAKRGRR